MRYGVVSTFIFLGILVVLTLAPILINPSEIGLNELGIGFGIAGILSLIFGAISISIGAIIGFMKDRKSKN